jgi:hypothetical protein
VLVSRQPPTIGRNLQSLGRKIKHAPKLPLQAKHRNEIFQFQPSPPVSQPQKNRLVCTSDGLSAVDLKALTGTQGDGCAREYAN